MSRRRVERNIAYDDVRKRYYVTLEYGKNPENGKQIRQIRTFSKITEARAALRKHEAARDMGVKNIVVTHPEWWIVGMSHEDQLRLVKDYDVILERCYAQNMGGGKYKSNLADNLELIKEVGYKNVMVDTDGGQTENPHWELALAEYMQYLVDHGIPEEHVFHMTHTIPAKLLGIEE